MARWKTLSDADLDARTIYVGTYGFDNCDGIGRLWARTLAGFNRAMQSAINAEARAYQSEDETFGETRDQMWYVGPFAETVADVIADMEDASRADELRTDIRASSSGYVY